MATVKTGPKAPKPALGIAPRTARAAKAKNPPEDGTKQREDLRKNKPGAYTNRGRPAIHEQPLEPLQTRVPKALRDYLKILPVLRLPDGRHYGTQQAMFEDCLVRFMREKPWKAGLAWRQPRATKPSPAGSTGWVQINIMVEAGFKRKVVAEAERLAASAEGAERLSPAGFCYTALYWWAQYVYPAAD